MAALIDPGNSERAKGAVHGAIGALAVLCAVYNLSAWKARHERHSAVNALVYLALIALELSHVLHHRSWRTAAKR